MSYEEFKRQLMSYVQDHIGEYMPPHYAGATVFPCSKPGYNGSTEDGLVLYMEGQQIAPMVYINRMYESFLRDPDTRYHIHMTESDKKVFTNEIANTFVKGMRESILKGYSVSGLIAEKYKPENLFMMVLNTEANQDILSEGPHREVLDLSIVYKVLISDESEDRIVSTRVTDLIAAQMGMTEEQIYQAAYENTRRLFPPRVASMQEMLREMSHEEIEEPYTYGAEAMVVATNDRKMNGACVMLYPDVLDEMAERFGTDIYICPSSVHEIIAVSEFGQTGEHMEEMVREVNAVEVPIKERLSNHAYFYDAKEKKLSLATDDIAPPINPDISRKATVAEDITYSLESVGFSSVSEGVSLGQVSGKPKEMTSGPSARQRGPKL